MNAYIHSEISVKKRGGKIEDYYAIHDFMDSTKELCSDNRHRILHTHWGIKQVIVPIFGHTLINSDGKTVNIKDLCEQDHILPDYHNRFIPTLADFVEAISPQENDLERFQKFFKSYKENSELTRLLLSPLSYTGQAKSLLITHNSWFINHIIPLIFNTLPNLKEFTIAPSELFNRMSFKLWMDNGSAYPESAKNLQKLKKTA
ncbi:MAG: hypothetical protein MUC49_13810 [Raineya sp.]|jgi:hypothetical protein|nr:hypothetical protein [Raineya sp.]